LNNEILGLIPIITSINSDADPYIFLFKPQLVIAFCKTTYFNVVNPINIFLVLYKSSLSKLILNVNAFIAIHLQQLKVRGFDRTMFERKSNFLFVQCVDVGRIVEKG